MSAVAASVRTRPVAASRGRACARAGGCRADEVPLPGPVIDGPVTRLGAGGRQRRRAALGARPRRRGRPLPRLPRLRPDQHATRCRCPSSPTAAASCAPTATAPARSCSPGARVVVDLSLSASVPSKSKDNEARRGMPDLPGTFEIGPEPERRALAVGATSAASSTCACRCARRSRCSARREPIGVTFSPNLNLDVRGFAGAWNLGLLAGPLFADRRHHQHFYGVAPRVRDRDAARLRRARRLRRLARDRRRSRAASATPGSAASSATTTCTARPSRPARWCGATPDVTAGFGISWIFATSSQRVRDRRLSGRDGAAAGRCAIALLFAAVIVQLGAMSLAWNLVAPLLSLLLPRRRPARLGRAAMSFIYRCCWATRRDARPDADRRERARRAARRARRADRRRQPSDDARRAGRRRPAAARRLRHEGRADAQRLPRRRRAAGALHPQRRRPRHGARRGRDAARGQPARAVPRRHAHGRRAGQRRSSRASR